MITKTPKPSFKKYFGPEIRNNLVQRFGTQLSQEDVVYEGEMYALDMCIEFQKQSGGLLSIDWIDHISSEVYAALREYVFDIDIPAIEFLMNVRTEMGNPIQAQIKVNIYYK